MKHSELRILPTWSENDVVLLKFSIFIEVLTEFPWEMFPMLIVDGLILIAGRENVTFIGTADVADLLCAWVGDLELSVNSQTKIYWCSLSSF